MNLIKCICLLATTLVGLLRGSAQQNKDAGDCAIRTTFIMENPSGYHDELTERFKKLEKVKLLDSVELQSISSEKSIENFNQVNLHKSSSNGSFVKWILYASSPVLVKVGSTQRNGMFISPGDSVYLKYLGNDKWNFSGRGHKGLELQQRLTQSMKSLTKPTKTYVSIKSLDDYLNWKNYLNNRENTAQQLFDEYKETMDTGLIKEIKLATVYQIEFERLNSFISLCGLEKNVASVTKGDLAAIFDSTVNNQWSTWLRQQTDNSFNANYFYNFTLMYTWKKFGFDLNQPDINSTAKRRYQYFSTINQLFEGELKERLLFYFITDKVIRKLGMKHELTNNLLNEYYKQSRSGAYRFKMEEFIAKALIKYNFAREDKDSEELSPGDVARLSKDGPYVFYENSKPQAYYIENNVAGQIKNIDRLPINTNEGRSFYFDLKSTLSIPPSVYERPEKLLVFSDIEGNFDALSLLLKRNKVINDRYEWTFGKGHLVFCGDMFDRGVQVTECLWLIYALEEKAKRAGGFVHFILGNHEVLNLSGDTRYVVEKYMDNADLLGKPYKELFGEQTELGRWLRTKNIVEKIGDELYMHAGASKEFNLLPLTLQEINDRIRPHYANRDNFKRNTKEPELKVLFNSDISPFWYRGYYKTPLATDRQVDSTLKKFDVRRIVTGHTIVADTISVHYRGKIINTDTHHAEGKSEALLIEGDKYYRVNQEGKRVLLFIDDRKKPN